MAIMKEFGRKVCAWCPVFKFFAMQGEWTDGWMGVQTKAHQPEKNTSYID